MQPEVHEKAVAEKAVACCCGEKGGAHDGAPTPHELMRPMKVACVGLECAFGEPDVNVERMCAAVAEAASAGAGWVCFPECALHGYHTDVERM